MRAAPAHLPDTPPERVGPSSEAARLLTAGQLAERWQVKQSTIYSLTRQGSIPTVKLGRLYRYRLDAIEEYERNGGGEADA
jgi:excisionase family DNA binding protein